MQPILFTIAGFPVSAFGLFLILAILAAAFVVWRIVRLYDIDYEKAIDLILVTAFSSIISARIFFVLFHLDQFNSISKVWNIVKFPGLPFWGGFLGGIIVLYLTVKRLKMPTFQVLDIAAVAFFLGLVFSSIGCLLGSCEYGLIYKGFLSVRQIGIVDARFPLQIVQSILAFLVFVILWRSILRFHTMGHIFAKGLIFLGLIKLTLEPFRPITLSLFQINLSYLFAVICLVLGLYFYYKMSKKSIQDDLTYLAQLILSSNKRQIALMRFSKKCYNFLVSVRFKLARLQKSLFRVFNIKSNPTKF